LTSLVNLTGGGTPRGSGSFTDNNLDNWLNDFGVDMHLVGLIMGIRVQIALNASMFYTTLEMALSFADQIASVHKIAEVYQTHSTRQLAGPDATMTDNTASNISMGNFKDPIVTIPTSKGVVSDNQEVPRSKLFMNARQENDVAYGTPSVAIRYMCYLYLKRG